MRRRQRDLGAAEPVREFRGRDAAEEAIAPRGQALARESFVLGQPRAVACQREEGVGAALHHRGHAAQQHRDIVDRLMHPCAHQQPRLALQRGVEPGAIDAPGNRPQGFARRIQFERSGGQIVAVAQDQVRRTQHRACTQALQRIAPAREQQVAAPRRHRQRVTAQQSPDHSVVGNIVRVDQVGAEPGQLARQRRHRAGVAQETRQRPIRQCVRCQFRRARLERIHAHLVAALAKMLDPAASVHHGGIRECCNPHADSPRGRPLRTRACSRASARTAAGACVAASQRTG